MSTFRDAIPSTVTLPANFPQEIGMALNSTEAFLPLAVLCYAEASS